jgi:hypothetical protein
MKNTTTQCRNENKNSTTKRKNCCGVFSLFLQCFVCFFFIPTLFCGVFHYSYIALWCFCFHSYIVLWCFSLFLPHNNVGIMKTPQNNVGMKTKSHQNSVGIMQNTTQCRNEKHNTMLEWKTQHNLDCVVFFFILALCCGVFVFIPTLCCGVFHYFYIVLWCFS